MFYPFLDDFGKIQDYFALSFHLFLFILQQNYNIENICRCNWKCQMTVTLYINKVETVCIKSNSA